MSLFINVTVFKRLSIYIYSLLSCKLLTNLHIHDNKIEDEFTLLKCTPLAFIYLLNNNIKIKPTLLIHRKNDNKFARILLFIY